MVILSCEIFYIYMYIIQYWIAGQFHWGKYFHSFHHWLEVESCIISALSIRNSNNSQSCFLGSFGDHNFERKAVIRGCHTHIQCYIQKMWLGGTNWEFPKCRGDKGVYNVLTFQKSRGARAHLGGQIILYSVDCSLNRCSVTNTSFIACRSTQLLMLYWCFTWTAAIQPISKNFLKGIKNVVLEHNIGI